MNAASNDTGNGNGNGTGAGTGTGNGTGAVNAESQGAVTVLTMSYPAPRNPLSMALRGALQARSWTR